MNDHSGIGKYQRIIGAGVEFASDDLFDVPERFLKRAEDLRRAAQRIGILNFGAGIDRFRTDPH